MGPTITLDSTVHIAGAMRAFGGDVVREEPSLAWSDLSFAADHGGPITRAFIEALPDDWRAPDVALQVKMTWLKRGWAAGPLGFHCDWLAVDGAGRRTVPDQRWPQAVCAVIGDCAMTRFVTGRLTLPAAPTQRAQRRTWTPHVRAQIADGCAREGVVEPGALFRFGPCSVHRRSRAAVSGWRMILRAVKRPGQAPFVWNRRWDIVHNGWAATPAEAERLAAYGEAVDDGWALARGAGDRGRRGSLLLVAAQAAADGIGLSTRPRLRAAPTPRPLRCPPRARPASAAHRDAPPLKAPSRRARAQPRRTDRRPAPSSRSSARR